MAAVEPQVILVSPHVQTNFWIRHLRILKHRKTAALGFCTFPFLEGFALLAGNPGSVTTNQSGKFKGKYTFLRTFLFVNNKSCQ